MKFRFHVLGVPHTKTNLDYTACAFTQKVYKFCKMMHDRGHYVIHYGVEGSNPECDENVVVVSDEIFKRTYSFYDYKKTMFKYDLNDECYQTFYKNTIAEIEKRKQPLDIILPFWGYGVKTICDAFPDLICVEPGIGYGLQSGGWLPYRVFESYAVMHAFWGPQALATVSPKYYDVVIPNYFDARDFEYNYSRESRMKDPYFLYLGRVYDGKGVNIAIQVCQYLGFKLKVAGQPDDFYKDYDWPENVEYIGYADAKTRKELMKNAVASFLPTAYLEPFGGVQVENLLCGTPTITSDWGGFAENNIEGVTGYRCRTFQDYVIAALKCYNGEIKYVDCRKKGEEFLLENVAPRYEKFFTEIINIFTGKGWYEVDPNLLTKNKK